MPDQDEKTLLVDRLLHELDAKRVARLLEDIRRYENPIRPTHDVTDRLQ